MPRSRSADELAEVVAFSSRVQQVATSTVGNSTDRELRARIANLEVEVKEHDEVIENMQKVRNEKAAELEELRQVLKARSRPAPNVNGSAGINYQTEQFDWDRMLLSRAKSIFGIQDFRLCQRGVCNANMDGRDIVCVMPTGGGKSLTYQLPALLTPGCTVIISPLIALIEDQVMNLRGHDVEAVMLLGSTKGSERDAIKRRMYDMINGVATQEPEINLCYMTPEKIVHDKSFQGILSRLYDAGKLARFVIDEAHCISSYGHDFRPDYQSLHFLRKSYPAVPIMAVSATCPPKVMEDIIKTLRLPPIVPGETANTQGTIYFTAPLYRKNLHYQILPKPSGKKESYTKIVDYILENHPNESGIIYCYSKNDSHDVADKIQELSGGKIRTGTYHAQISTEEKRRLHENWRSGKVHVVCATIAFGMGIDKGDVRFVIHHTIPKSLEGFYQESGRAGRDGKDADCVLWYRPQDGMSVAGMIDKDKDGTGKVHELLAFVQDCVQCRKIQFANHFRHSWQLSIESWTTQESNVLDPCGHCDNCKRDPASLVKKDLTLAAWQIMRVVSEVKRVKAKITLAALASLVRGKGKGAVEAKGRGRSKQSIDIDLDNVCGGPVDLTTEEVERLVIHLLVQKYLQEEVVSNTYASNVYLCLGPQAPIYTRLSKSDVLARTGTRRIELTFVLPEKSKGKKVTAPKSKKPSSAAQKTAIGKGKGKRVASSSDEAEDIHGDSGIDDDDMYDLGDRGPGERPDTSGEYIDPDGGLAGQDYISESDEDDGEPVLPRRAAGGSSSRTTTTSKRPRNPLTAYSIPSSSRTASQTASSSGSGPASRPTRSAAALTAKKPSFLSTEVIEVEDSDDDIEWEENQRGRKLGGRGASPPRKRARKENGPTTILGDVITLSD